MNHYTKASATETLEIFLKALGLYDLHIHDEWDSRGAVFAVFEMDYLRGSASVNADFKPGVVLVSIWEAPLDIDQDSEVVRVTATASIALATVNMALADYQMSVASA